MVFKIGNPIAQAYVRLKEQNGIIEMVVDNGKESQRIFQLHADGTCVRPMLSGNWAPRLGLQSDDAGRLRQKEF